MGQDTQKNLQQLTKENQSTIDRRPSGMLGGTVAAG